LKETEIGREKFCRAFLFGGHVSHFVVDTGYVQVAAFVLILVIISMM
jgi:hypothetical protein